MPSVFDHRVLFFDTETTGLDLRLDKIVQISGVSIIKNDKKSYKEYDMIINPKIHVPEKVGRIHGLPDRVLEQHKPMTEELFRAIVSMLLETTYMCTFNGIYFDKPRLELLIKIYGKKFLGIDETKKILQEKWMREEWLDVFIMVKSSVIYPRFMGLPNIKQASLCAHYGIKYNAHNSLQDCLALMRLFFSMIEDEVLPDDYHDLLLIQAGTAP